MDVRKSKDIGAFRDLVIAGPLTLVLVYADWCGHCTTFKNNVWNRVATAPATNRNLNMASVHYDMVDQTPLKNAKIEGYPSLLLVGTDEKPATFAGQEPAAANAMPNQPQTPEQLESMLATPLSGTVRNATAVATEVVNNVNANANIKMNANANTDNSMTVLPASTEPISQVTKGLNTYVPSTEMPPDAATDIATARTPLTTMRGGSLLESLYAVAKEGAHAGLLLASSAALSRRLYRRRKTRKSKSGKKGKTRRSH